jgi:hypothetical protein
MEILLEGVYDATVVTVTTAIMLAPRAIDAYLAWRDSKEASEKAE